jgi:hypothetical protein
MHRHSYEYVKAYFESRGYTLLSTLYKDSHQKLDVRCPENHEYSVSFISFKDKEDGRVGHRCRTCWRAKTRHSQTDVERYLKEHGGYTLQEHATYTGFYKPLLVICPKGHPHETTFARFKRGIPCEICTDSSRYLTYEDIKEYFQERGYKLVSTEYKGVHEKLDTICPKGHPYKVCFAVFKDKKDGKIGSRCSTCCTNNHKHTQEYIEGFLEEYGYQLQEGEVYKGIKHKLKVICPEGHLFPVSFESFKRGSRCTCCKNVKNSKYTMKEVKEYVEKYDYILVSTTYNGSHGKLHLNCPKGHLYITTFNNFKNSNTRCRTCYLENLPKKEDHPMWSGGGAQVKGYVRGYLKEWKDKSLQYHGGKCVITGESENLEIHHLYSFELIFREVLEDLNLPLYETIGEYTSEQLKTLVEQCKKAHDKYPLGVPLTEKVHTFFHSLYPKETIPEQFYEFAKEYFEMDWDSIQFPKIYIPKRKRESLTDEEAVEAWKRVNAGESCSNAALHFGVTGSTIENLVNGKTYKHLNLEKLELSPDVSDKQVEEIRQELQKGVTGVELAKCYNLSTSVISAIRRGSSGHPNSKYKHLPPLEMGWRKGKLTRDQILEIRERAKEESPSTIALDYGISRQLVNDIKANRRYKNVI